MTDIALDDPTRPIVGIENRTAQEVFDIMCDRFRRTSPSQVAPQPQAGEPVEKPYAYEFGRSNGDDTFSVSIERSLPAKPHPDWPIKPLYASPQPANPVQVTDAWLEYERTRIKGDNPQCHPYIYFQRGYEAAIAANPAQVGGSNLAERAKAVRGDLEAHNFDDVIALLDDYAAAIGAGGQAVAIISKAEAKLAAYAFDEDEETEFSREDAVFVLSALSQPHPADERVVEVLEPGTIRICPTRDRPCPHGLGCPYVDGYNCTDPALSAKEGR